MQLVRQSFPGRPAFDIAVSHALLLRVARAQSPATLRAYRPSPTLAFGRLDALRPGYAAAREAALRHGFTPVLRLGGGHAAAFDEGSLVLEEVTPQPAVAQGLSERFERMTDLLAGAVAGVGADARIGELPGEYCSGAWSVNVGGRTKVAGTAQRVVRGAALVTAVIVVTGGERVRAVLVDVYEALGLERNPRPRAPSPTRSRTSRSRPCGGSRSRPTARPRPASWTRGSLRWPGSSGSPRVAARGDSLRNGPSRELAEHDRLAAEAVVVVGQPVKAREAAGEVGPDPVDVAPAGPVGLRHVACCGALAVARADVHNGGVAARWPGHDRPQPTMKADPGRAHR